jgi:ABC-type phosphate transport system substrate-binding protein
MRMLSKLLAGSAAAAAVVALTAVPAMADPPSGTVPSATDAVATGSNTTQYLLDALSAAYNKTHSTGRVYSWDAVNPDTLAIGDNIVAKKGCAAIPRPDGSSAGIAQLETNVRPSGDSTHFCEDFARSSRGRASTDPACATGGICFVSLAGDAVTWAARNAASGGTNAPATLTPSQLASIFECKTTNWSKVGGKSGKIKAFLPQEGSGTLSFWLTALGGGVTPITPGACVSDLPTKSEPGGSLEENEGINPALNNANTIFIYSVGAYLSQAFHSPKCTNKDCSPVKSGPPCKAKAGKNQFGCDETGVLGLEKISGSAPTKPFPPVKSSVTNTGFPRLFQRTLYDVVRFDPNTTDHIPGGESGSPGGINLEKFFSAASAKTPGFFCTSSTAKTLIKDYGFLPKWPLSTCGAVS